jgi:hypothetical protein
MDFDPEYQPCYQAVPNNPPPQNPDTSGTIGLQGSTWRFAHTVAPGHQASSSFNGGNTFQFQNSVTCMPAGTETLNEDTFQQLCYGSTGTWPGTNASVPGGTVNFYQSVQPLDDRSVFLGQGTGFPFPLGRTDFDQRAVLRQILYSRSLYESGTGGLGGHAIVPEFLEGLPDLHEGYFDPLTMAVILPETSMIPDNSANTWAFANKVSTQGLSHLEETTIGNLSTIPQDPFEVSWGNTQTFFEGCNDLEMTDESLDASHLSAFELGDTIQHLERDAMRMTLFNNPKQASPSIVRGKSLEETQTSDKKRKALNIELERKRSRIPGLKQSEGEVSVFNHSFNETSREKTQKPRNKDACVLCRDRKKNVSQFVIGKRSYRDYLHFRSVKALVRYAICAKGHVNLVSRIQSPLQTQV